MKNVLITGENGYIATHLYDMLSHNSQYKAEKISLKGSSWIGKDFSAYDAVVHLAGVVHNKRADQDLYENVNINLTKKLAVKAKKENVKHFIFMSTMSVYGEIGDLKDSIVIDINTKLNPKDEYARSKIEAEKVLKELSNSSFKLLIMRPPMVYGTNSPGNFSRLALLSNSPVFPLINNRRSAIQVETLCEKIISSLANEAQGVMLPQDEEYFNTSSQVKRIAEKKGRSIYLSPLLGKLISTFFYKHPIVKKMFGNLIYK